MPTHFWVSKAHSPAVVNPSTLWKRRWDLLSQALGHRKTWNPHMPADRTTSALPATVRPIPVPVQRSKFCLGPIETRRKPRFLGSRRRDGHGHSTDRRRTQTRFRHVTNYPCVKDSSWRFPRCSRTSNQLSNRPPLFPVTMIYTRYRIDEQICQKQYIRR